MGHAIQTLTRVAMLLRMSLATEHQTEPPQPINTCLETLGHEGRALPLNELPPQTVKLSSGALRLPDVVNERPNPQVSGFVEEERLLSSTRFDQALEIQETSPTNKSSDQLAVVAEDGRIARDPLKFRSGGFRLFVPPIPFAQPPQQPRFVMLDDVHQTFYDVDYGNHLLRNMSSWTDIAVHELVHPAIVFPPTQSRFLQTRNFATGFLVSIMSSNEGVNVAKKVGAVNVSILSQNAMSWDALRSLKGNELPNEMRHGIMRRLWDKRPKDDYQKNEFMVRGTSVSSTRRAWPQDGALLSTELDGIFAGGEAITSDQLWELTG